MRSKLLYIFIALMIAAFAAYLLRVAFVGDPFDDWAQVKDLRLAQEGSDIEVNWGSMDCDGYEVIVTRNGNVTVIPRLEDTTYTIHGVCPGERCAVTVRAYMKHGMMSRGAREVLTAEKIDQNILVEDTSFYGFAGSDFALNAEANGNLHYRSEDRNIASVDDRGRIAFRKSGETTIVVTAEGNGYFQETEREISILVYPTVLDKITGTAVETLSPSRAVIRWKENEYASAYKILRKNAATQEYKEIKETPAEVTYLEVTRDDCDYRVKGIAEVNGEKVDGKLSDDIPVRGTTAESPSYPKFTVIKKLRKTDLDRVAEIHGEKGTRVPQSLSIIGDEYVVSYVNKKETRGNLIAYSKADGTVNAVTEAKGIGHGNGSAYDPNTNRLYVLSFKNNGEDAKSCRVYEADTRKFIKKINMPVECTSIAYDISNNKFYLAKGNKMYVCDSSFKVEKTMSKTVKLRSTQDVGAYNSAIMACTWPGKNKSYIDIYRISDGGYLGSYDVSIGEIESCAMDDGYLVILMNTVRSGNDYIYRTKERIAIP